MATQKLYAGAKLRETRTRLGLTQKAFAERLGVSLPYLNQMENNHRPVSSAVIFKDGVPPVVDLRLISSNAPAMARAFLSLHRAYLQANERLASLDEALGQSDVRPGASPWDEVRDFFHYCDNYLDAMDRAAERFSGGRSADDALTPRKGCCGSRRAQVMQRDVSKRFCRLPCSHRMTSSRQPWTLRGFNRTRPATSQRSDLPTILRVRH